MKTKIRNLLPGDIISLDPALPDYDVIGAEPAANDADRILVTMTDQRDYGGTFGFDADHDIEVVRMQRTVQIHCMLCTNLYSHTTDLALASNPRGICGPCDTRTTAEVLRGRG